MKTKNKFLSFGAILMTMATSPLSLHADNEYYYGEPAPASSSSTIVMNPEGNGSIKYAFAEFDTQNIQFSNRLGYESEHVYRGALRGRNAFFNDLQGKYAFDEVDIYTGLYTIFPNTSEARYANEIDPYVGARSEIHDGLFLDAGYSIYRYAKSTTFHNKRTTHEVFFGASADYIANPGIYLFYDFTLEQVVLEGSVGHSFDLEEYLGLTNFALETKGAVGLLYARQWYGKNPKRKNHYNYAAVNADLLYSFNDRTTLRTGFRAAINSDHKSGPANIFGSHPATVGWGISMNIDF